MASRSVSFTSWFSGLLRDDKSCSWITCATEVSTNATVAAVLFNSYVARTVQYERYRSVDYRKLPMLDIDRYRAVVLDELIPLRSCHQQLHQTLLTPVAACTCIEFQVDHFTKILQRSAACNLATAARLLPHATSSLLIPAYGQSKCLSPTTLLVVDQQARPLPRSYILGQSLPSLRGAPAKPSKTQPLTRLGTHSRAHPCEHGITTLCLHIAQLR